ncbi:MAG: hypothetical protein CMM52_08225 [Rhodospirillaceae bacterium]|nr:hypothetical protein [Rhodospirillaceae bacterium]
MNLAAVRDVLRLKTLSDASNSGRPVTVIARSAGSREATELTRKEFEKGLQLKVNHTLPRDLKNLSEAAKSGCAVTASAPKSELSKAIGGLAIELSGRSETFHKNSSLWRRLVKRGS